MPQKDPPPTVSFTIPVVKDSPAVGYKTVHVIVVDPITKEEEGGFEVIVAPFLIVLAIAASLVFILLKIKPGKSTDRILSRLEGSANIIDRKIESGDL